MNVIAIVPARGQSKRLPGKNIMMLGSRPMLAYSVLLARSLDAVGRVVVSSDSEKILAVGEQWGAEPILRPPELAQDDSGMAETLQHALAEAEKSMAAGYDMVVLLQPNVPLRRQADCLSWMQAAGECQRRPDLQGALTVDIAPVKTGVLTGGLDGLSTFRPSYAPGARKQDMPPQARENGVFYLLKAANVRRGEVFGPPPHTMLALPTRREQSLANVDYEFEMELAAHFFTKYGYNEEYERIERELRFGAAKEEER